MKPKVSLRRIALASALIAATHASSAFAVTACQDDLSERFLDEVCRNLSRTEIADAAVFTDLIVVDLLAGNQIAVLELMNEDGDVICEIVDETVADGPEFDLCFQSGRATTWRITVN